MKDRVCFPGEEGTRGARGTFRTVPFTKSKKGNAHITWAQVSNGHHPAGSVPLGTSGESDLCDYRNVSFPWECSVELWKRE
jgi:hypothetical protein